MALLRLRYEAECLIAQLTKQNLSGQPIPDARSKPPLQRERFSPLAGMRRTGCWQRTAGLYAVLVIKFGRKADTSDASAAQY
jgi:hypothetical protein